MIAVAGHWHGAYYAPATPTDRWDIVAALFFIVQLLTVPLMALLIQAIARDKGRRPTTAKVTWQLPWPHSPWLSTLPGGSEHRLRRRLRSRRPGGFGQPPLPRPAGLAWYPRGTGRPGHQLQGLAIGALVWRCW